MQAETMKKLILFMIVLIFVSPAQGVENEELNPLRILNQATEIARTIENERYQTIDEGFKIEVLIEIARVKAEAGEQSESKLLFDQLIQKVTAIQGFLPEAKKFQEARRDDLSSDGFKKMEEGNRELITRWKVTTLDQIAQAQMEAGLSIDARLTFSRAVQFVDEIPSNPGSSGRSEMLMKLGIDRLKAGDRHGADDTFLKVFKVLDSMTDNETHFLQAYKIELSLEIAMARFESGDTLTVTAAIQKALATAKTSKDPMLRSNLLRDIAIDQARMGNGSAALETLQNMLDTRSAIHGQNAEVVPLHNMIDVLRISRSFIESDKPKEAEQLIGKAIGMMQSAAEDSSKFKSTVWWKISEVRAQLGDIKGALEAATTATEGLPPAVPEEIVQALIRTGDLEEARQFAGNNIILLRDIAIAQAGHGNVKGALQTVSAIKRYNLTVSIPPLRAIAAAQVKDGEAKEALAWANTLSTPREKAYALLGVAEGLLSQKRSSSNAASRD
jgi:hypothetical protein